MLVKTYITFNNILFHLFTGVSALTLAAIQQKGTENLKRKSDSKGQQKGSKKPRQKKQSKENNDQNKDESGLSETDKKLLERWESMRKKTKPFIHPIRKYMEELNALKEEAIEVGNQTDTVLPTPVAAQPIQQFQFTQFVPQDCNGNVAALKAVKVPFTVTPNLLIQQSPTQSFVNGKYRK